MLDTQSRLNQALEVIFTDARQIGFWDEKNNRITSRLEFDENFNWKIGNSDGDRYGVFTLTCILLAKHLYNLDTQKYDSRIISYLKYINATINTYDVSVITYGALNSLILGKIIYKNQTEFCTQTIETTINELANKLPQINNNEYSLVLIGLSYYYRFINKKQQVHDHIKMLVKGLLNAQDKRGFFMTGDLRGNYHQRIMYTLWGLTFSSEICCKQEIDAAVKKSLGFIWENRRDGKDNAFIWHPSLYFIKNKLGIPMPVLSIRSAKYLFECHQTFFANAVHFYKYFYANDLLQKEAVSAMDWIFGKNRISKDLVEISKIGIPTRILTQSGTLFVPNQNFKGSYEVGSYILALSKYNSSNEKIS